MQSMNYVRKPFVLCSRKPKVGEKPETSTSSTSLLSVQSEQACFLMILQSRGSYYCNTTSSSATWITQETQEHMGGAPTGTPTLARLHPDSQRLIGPQLVMSYFWASHSLQYYL